MVVVSDVLVGTSGLAGGENIFMRRVRVGNFIRNLGPLPAKFVYRVRPKVRQESNGPNHHTLLVFPGVNASFLACSRQREEKRSDRANPPESLVHHFKVGRTKKTREPTRFPRRL